MEYAHIHEAELEELDAVDIGKHYIDSLMNQNRFAEAAANLKIVSVCAVLYS